MQRVKHTHVMTSNRNGRRACATCAYVAPRTRKLTIPQKSEFEDLTVPALRVLAEKRDIPRRSKMTKSQLIAALTDFAKNQEQSAA